MEWVSEWASQLIKVIRKMGNVLLLLADEYAFGQQLANCVNWKTNENETKTDETFFFSIQAHEKNGTKTSTWMDWTTGSDGSNNVNILFHRYSCRQTRWKESCEILIFLCYYFATLVISSLFLNLFFSFFLFFKLFFPVPFHSAFFSDRFIVIVAIVEFFFAHSLWSF